MARTLGVVIPHFNDSRFLAEAVGSCLLGERSPDRILIVDDGSSPAEFAAVESMIAGSVDGASTRIDLLRHTENRGVVATLNHGLAAIGTDYVLFRAADDRTLPGYFAAIMTRLEASPTTALGVADQRYYTESPATGVDEPLGLPRDGYFSPDELARHLSATRIIHSGATIFNRSLLAAVGGFDPAVDLYHDWWACHQLALRHGLVYWPHPGTAFRLRADSVSSRCYQDLARAHRSTAAVQDRLNQESGDVRARFERAHLLDFFASIDQRTTIATPAIDTAPTGGIEAVLSRRLAEFAPTLRQVAGHIFIFGAGNHTRALLREWRRLDLPRPAGIVSSQPAESAFESLPVSTPQSLALGASDVLILSSKSFEETMAAIAAETQPLTPRLSFWNPGLTTLSPAAVEA
ncbi:MAG TPA: glycosyltransferase [Opitutaceae bacterium]|nr:glycosyltransferase [Opitutaceae bacterium]